MNIEKTPEQSFPKESVEGNINTAMYGDTVYDVYKLIHHAESLKEEIVPLDSLEGNKNGNYWHDKEGEWLGPHHLLSAIEKYHGQPNWDEIEREHPGWAETIIKIKNADYQSYPILVVGESDVIDGMNRLTKAWIDGVKDIKVKRFNELPNEAIYTNDKANG